MTTAEAWPGVAEAEAEAVEAAVAAHQGRSPATARHRSSRSLTFPLLLADCLLVVVIVIVIIIIFVVGHST